MLTCAALTIGLHLATAHVGPYAEELRDFNPGAYARCDDIVAGAYRNSQGRGSVYVAKVYAFGRIELAAGAVTGYELGPVLPLVVPSIKVGRARLSLLLPIDKNAGGVHLSWEF